MNACVFIVKSLTAFVMCSVPLQLVEYQIDGVWWPAARSVNNQWPYHREIGDFNFPLPIRVTSVAGEVLLDTVPSSSGMVHRLNPLPLGTPPPPPPPTPPPPGQVSPVS